MHCFVFDWFGPYGPENASQVFASCIPFHHVDGKDACCDFGSGEWLEPHVLRSSTGHTATMHVRTGMSGGGPELELRYRFCAQSRRFIAIEGWNGEMGRPAWLFRENCSSLKVMTADVVVGFAEQKLAEVPAVQLSLAATAYMHFKFPGLGELSGNRLAWDEAFSDLKWAAGAAVPFTGAGGDGFGVLLLERKVSDSSFVASMYGSVRERGWGVGDMLESRLFSNLGSTRITMEAPLGMLEEIVENVV